MYYLFSDMVIDEFYVICPRVYTKLISNKMENEYRLLTNTYIFDICIHYIKYS